MRKWTTNATAIRDTRVGRLERWAVDRGWFWMANVLARWRR
jgi:hypothetical protein